MNIPEKEPFTLSVRGFTARKDQPAPSGKRYASDPGPSGWALIFDTETTVDERQCLRFGFYQLREGDTLAGAGAFYNPEELTAQETRLLRRFVRERHLVLTTANEFAESMLVGTAYELNAAIVGFNLPFDLSRLAIGHGNAQPSKGNFSMVGGFSFQYSWNREKPRIQVKHLNSRSSLIRFTVPMQPQDTARSRRKKNLYTHKSRGYFVDLRSLAAALLSGSHSLKSLCQHLGTESQKHDTDEHGKMTLECLEYAYQDVQATWECYLKLKERYEGLRLRTPVNRILSEASLGKAYLQQMEVKPWREVQPDFPPSRIGEIMSSFYGGRAEVKVRRKPVRAAYCDFLSMYPTVCTLMGLWRFVVSEGVIEHDATDQVRGFLDSVSLDDLGTKDTWTGLNCLVKVLPDADVYPVRAKYDSKSRSIGLNYLSSPKPLWFTLADCIASKLMTGKSPHVIEAVRFEPRGRQAGLESVNIAGNSDYRVDPSQDDFIKKCIELRTDVKAKKKHADEKEASRLDSEQLALKICANATSYGIYVELNANSHGTPVEQDCHGYSGIPFTVKTKSVEEPGKYFHPLLGTLITGAARLMLACCETVALRQGLSWAFCDTDGIALTSLDENEPHKEFHQKVESVRDWFSGLNPYRGDQQILKLEDENYSLDGEGLEPLYCFAVSAKRYALYNLASDGTPVLRKATAHGLGHIRAPYGEENAPGQIPAPKLPCRKTGVARWQHDLWYRIVVAALNGNPKQVELSDLPGFDAPAVSQYSATSPDILTWFDKYNSGKDYRGQVRPFGFLLSLQAKADLGYEAPRGVSPFNPDVSAAVEACFDRISGKPVEAGQLKTIANAVAQFHLHPESKFLGGDYVDSGETQRRHIWASSIEHIGKEANKWEEQMHLGESPEVLQVYGSVPVEDSERLERLIAKGRKISRRKLAKASGVSLRQITRILNYQSTPTELTLALLESSIRRPINEATQHTISSNMQHSEKLSSQS